MKTKKTFRICFCFTTEEMQSDLFRLTNSIYLISNIMDRKKSDNNECNKKYDILYYYIITHMFKNVPHTENTTKRFVP